MTLATKLQSLQQMTTPELRQRMVEKLTVTAEALAEVAAIVRILEEDRHEDLSGLKIGIMPILRKIAYGQLMPEIVTQFAGNDRLLKYAQCLPIPDQRRLVAGEKMRVLLPDGSDTRLVEAHRMTTREIQQVFAHDHIRDEGEQRGYIEDHRKPAPRIENDVRVDPRRGGATINGKWFTRAELASLLARLG